MPVVIQPLSVYSRPQNLLSNATIYTNGSIIVSGSYTGLSLSVSVGSVSAGTSIQFFMQDLDPGDGVTPIGAVVSGAVITSGPAAQTINFTASRTNLTKISWVTSSRSAISGASLSVSPAGQAVSNSTKQVIRSNEKLISRGAAIVDASLLNRNVSIFINVAGQALGVNSNLSVSVFSLDPNNNSTITGTVATSSTITSTGNQVLNFINTTFTKFQVVWTVTGAGFTGVYITALMRTLSGVDGVGSMSGDISGSVSSTVVTGIQGNPISPATPVSGNGLVWNGSDWTPSSVPLAGDLSGTTSAASVISITGNPVQPQTLGASQDGFILTWVNASQQWVALPNGGGTGAFVAGGDLTGTHTNQTVSKLQGSTLSAPVSVGSANKVLHGDSAGTLNWSLVNLSTDVTGSLPASGVAAGTAGQIFVTNATPATTWTSLIQIIDITHGIFQAGGNGSDMKAIIGPDIAAPTAAALVHLLPAATAATGSNYSVYGDGSVLALNAPGGTIEFQSGTAGMLWLQNGSSSIISFTLSKFEFAESLSPLFFQDARGSDAAPHDFVISPQAPFATAVTNLNASNVQVLIPYGIGALSAKYGGFNITYGVSSYSVAALGAYGGTNTQSFGGALWLGNGSTPNNTANWSFYSNGTAGTIFNAPGTSMQFRIANATQLGTWDNLRLTLNGALNQAVELDLQVANANVLSLIAGEIIPTAPTIAWVASAVSPTITQAANATGAGQIMTIAAQDAHATSGQAGGTLDLKSGVSDGSGFQGMIQINPTSTFITAAGANSVQFTAGTIQSYATIFQWVAGATSPTITQVQAASGSGQNMLIAAQAAAALSNGNGGDLRLEGGTHDGTGLDGYVIFPRLAGLGSGYATISNTGAIGFTSLISATGISPGTAGQIYITNGTPSSTWTSLINLELVHGRFTSGGSGTDFKTVIGPLTGFETTYSALWLLANAASPTVSNPAIYSDGSTLFISTPGSSNITFVSAGSTILAQIEGTHGKITSGGSGTNWKTEIGPLIANETTNSAIWMLPPATPASNGNETFAVDATTVYYNSHGTLHNFYVNDFVTLVGSISSTSWLNNTTQYLFGTSVISPTFSQVSATAAAGQKLTIISQSTSFAAANGGDILLTSGTGGAGGVPGIVHIADDKASITTVIGYNGGVGAGATLLVGNPVYIEAYQGGGALDVYCIAMQLDWGGSLGGFVSWDLNNIAFHNLATTPKIWQYAQATASGTGATLTIQAQNETGTTSTGGALALTSGTGTSVAGNVLLQTGGVTKVTVTPTLLSSTSDIAIGTNPATTGGLRLYNNTGLYGRNVANNADIRMVHLDNGNILRYGATNTAADVIFEAPATNSIVIFTTPRLLFAATTTNVAIAHSDLSTNGGTGGTLTLQAQNETGTTSTGGALVLTTGTGTTVAGTLHLQTGGSDQITIVPSAASNINITPPIVQWVTGTASPILKQVDTTGNGQTMTVQAQNTTGAGGTVGGNLDLTSGSAATAALAGNVLVQTGGTTRITVAPAGITVGTTGQINSLVGSYTYTTRLINASPFTVDSSSITDYYLDVNTSGAAGGITITLPAPTNGRTLILRDITGSFGANPCVLAQYSTEKINGLAASKTLTANWGSWIISSNGTDWFVM